MFNLDDCMAFITSQSAKIFSEALERRFRPYNVTRAQWIVLYYPDFDGLDLRTQRYQLVKKYWGTTDG